MKDITKKEMELILFIFKNPEKEYNANNIASKIDITSMGALKIMKKLGKQGILKAKKLGKAVFYKINFGNDYAIGYLTFLLKKEAEQTTNYIKRWIYELKKLKNAEIILLFGSVLEKGSKSNDVDILLVTGQKKFEKLKEEINNINKISEKNIHTIYQSIKDLKKNIENQDKIILGAIKGIVILGHEKLIEVLK